MHTCSGESGTGTCAIVGVSTTGKRVAKTTKTTSQLALTFIFSCSFRQDYTNYTPNIQKVNLTPSAPFQKNNRVRTA
jgi:hypothetical protein